MPEKAPHTVIIRVSSDKNGSECHGYRDYTFTHPLNAGTISDESAMKFKLNCLRELLLTTRGIKLYDILPAAETGQLLDTLRTVYGIYEAPTQ